MRKRRLKTQNVRESWIQDGKDMSMEREREGGKCETRGSGGTMLDGDINAD